jgi:uncharacterized repeat protein (TIGR02543 family)
MKNNLAPALVLALILLPATAGAADPVVSNLTATQRAGTKLVDITYDVTADTPTVFVSLEISSDGGTTFSVLATNVSGAIGVGVATGIGKIITWDAISDWSGQYSAQMRFKVTATEIPVGMSLIPAGTFTMGDSLDGMTNAPTRTVTLSAFYMGQREVTKAEWDAVKAWAVSHGYTDLADGGGKATNHPVQTVTWWDVVKWCNAKSEKEGLSPCYAVNGSVMKTGITVPTVTWTANGYRLPTEAEWEKAARGGLSGKRFPWGDTISHTQANFYNFAVKFYQVGTTGFHPIYGTGSYPYTAPVGSFAANGYGLHDMAGNVYEWCWDWYGAYASGTQTDPRGAALSSNRVYRGGSCDVSEADECRVAERNNGYAAPGDPSSSRNLGLGFRPARSSVPVGGFGFAITVNVVVNTGGRVVLITAAQHGTVVGAGDYLPGSTATLIATAAPGYAFTGWSGDASGTANPLNLIMDNPKTITATFTPDTNDDDGDGLTNYQEIVEHGTDPNKEDTDEDGTKDKADAFPLDPTETLDTDRDGTGDNADPDDDNDGYSDTDEINVHHTNPKRADSDSDGLTDPAEIQTHHTNPSLADTDNDGLRDGEEFTTYHTNPLVGDTDGDGFLDGYEVLSGKLPLDPLDKPALVAEARTAIEFTFSSALGKTYRIEASTDLAAWEIVESGIAGTGGEIQRFYSTRGQPKRYFRVEEVAAP